MIEKEIAEVRRAFRPEHHAISSVCGCYVSAAGEILARFSRPMGLMPEEEARQYLSIFRKTLSGAPDRNLLDIAFSNDQVTGGAEYALLNELKRSELKDAAALDRFYTAVAGALRMDENYLILLACNKYDVPYRAGDGSRVDDASDSVYTCLVCSICPVRMTKSLLCYRPEEKDFREQDGSSAVCPPALGFLFPAFDNRQTNIYNALFYTRNVSQAYESFTEAVFCQSIRMTAPTQNETFRSVLADALEEDCSFRVARTVHDEICRRMEEHKANHEQEPLSVSKYEVKDMLETCGVSAERLEAFAKGYTENFGAGTELNPKNIVNPKQFELRTPDVLIRVTPGRSDLVETRTIDGNRYILIRANEGVELNGLRIAGDSV